MKNMSAPAMQNQRQEEVRENIRSGAELNLSFVLMNPY